MMLISSRTKSLVIPLSSTGIFKVYLPHSFYSPVYSVSLVLSCAHTYTFSSFFLSFFSSRLFLTNYILFICHFTIYEHYEWCTILIKILVGSWPHLTHFLLSFYARFIVYHHRRVCLFFFFFTFLRLSFSLFYFRFSSFFCNNSLIYQENRTRTKEGYIYLFSISLYSVCVFSALHSHCACLLIVCEKYFSVRNFLLYHSVSFTILGRVQ